MNTNPKITVEQALHILKRDDLAWNTLNDYVMLQQGAQNFRDNEIGDGKQVLPCQLCAAVGVELTIVCLSCLGHAETLG
jgi:hypothetical protein